MKDTISTIKREGKVKLLDLDRSDARYVTAPRNLGVPCVGIIAILLVSFAGGYANGVTVPSEKSEIVSKSWRNSSNTSAKQIPDCDKPDVYNTLTVQARSSVDRKVYSVQICTVVDSTDGEEFRNEVETK